MGFQDYIGEQEACSFAGVSAATLRRFAEAGYFQIETDSDGLRLFSKSELESLFGLKPLTSSRPKAAHTTSTLNVEKMTAPPTPPAEPSRGESIPQTVYASPAPHPQADAAGGVVRGAGTVVRAPITEPPAHEVTPTIAEPAPTAQMVAQPLSSPAPTRGAALEALEREATKLQNIVALQEKLLDIREEELRSVKGERDWLRSRIEKLEEKNERDQLLLLAETQTVRQLINLQQRRGSTVQRALEWLGLKSPLAAPGQPIDISPSTQPRSTQP